MAEGMLEGVLGGEDEKSPPPKVGAEPFAAAVVANLANHNPEVATETVSFLRKQSKLLDAQRKSVEAEHEYFEAEWGPRLLALRLRTLFQVLFAMFAFSLAIGGIILVYDATTSKSVVIEPFETSRALSERGQGGPVVASGVLDQLARIQAATRTSMQQRHLSNAWSHEVRLTVPEAGLSIGEISQLLRARFGDDIHIGGDVVQTQTEDLELTVRGDGVSPRTFTGAGDSLAKLSTQAAEYVYAQSQPALWAIYLVDLGRFTEAVEFCRASIGSSTKADQPILLTNWADAIAKSTGASTQALALTRRAVAVQPTYWQAYNIMSALKQGLGDEEGAWRTGEEMRKIAGGRPGQAPETAYSDADYVSWNLPAQLAAFTADAEASSGSGTFTFVAGPQIALLHIWMHDPASAEFAMQTTKADAGDPTIAAAAHAVQGMLAADAGDVVRSVSEWEAYLAAYANPSVAWVNYGLNCWVAPAEEAAGHPEMADEVLKAGGRFVDCYRFRGDILDHRGDWAGAQKAYAEAVALAPDLPAGYYSWGVALAKHGDLDGAASKFRDANDRQPQWADPLRAWGDVLVKQGHTTEAIAKYDEALKYAPNWSQLKKTRAELTKQLT